MCKGSSLLLLGRHRGGHGVCSSGLGALWRVIFHVVGLLSLQISELRKAVSILAPCHLGFLASFFVSIHTWQVSRSIQLGQIEEQRMRCMLTAPACSLSPVCRHQHCLVHFPSTRNVGGSPHLVCVSWSLFCCFCPASLWALRQTAWAMPVLVLV